MRMYPARARASVCAFPRVGPGWPRRAEALSRDSGLAPRAETSDSAPRRLGQSWHSLCFLRRRDERVHGPWRCRIEPCFPAPQNSDDNAAAGVPAASGAGPAPCLGRGPGPGPGAAGSGSLIEPLIPHPPPSSSRPLRTAPIPNTYIQSTSGLVCDSHFPSMRLPGRVQVRRPDHPGPCPTMAASAAPGAAQAGPRRAPAAA